MRALATALCTLLACLAVHADAPIQSFRRPLPEPPVGGSGPGEIVLVEQGSPMRYLENQVDPGLGSSWVEPGFDDTAWNPGAYGVGYETETGAEQLLATPVLPGASSVYTRATFTIDDPAAVANLAVGVDYDDGHVVWINGVEVLRAAEMPAGPPAWDTRARSHESSNGGVARCALVDVTDAARPALRQGTNVLAVGVWNAEAASSDLVVVPKLVLNRPLQIVRGPYLQMGTDSAVTVRWRTNLPSTSRVWYGAAADALDAVAGEDQPTTEHEVRLTGLEAGRRYAYAVGASGGRVSRADVEHAFVTAPLPGTPRRTRIWVLGDSGSADDDAARVRDAFAQWTGATPTDLWLMLGDNAYPDGTDAEYQAAVFDMYPDMLRRAVLWPTFGNHDGHVADSATQTGPYYDVFTLPAAGQTGGVPSGTEAYYSFDWANVHFVCLESYELPRGGQDAMLTWLQQDLAETTQDWTIAFWHHPPYSKGSHDSDLDIESREMRENALPILEAAGVDLVLTGHSHSYERSLLVDGHYGPSWTFSPSHVKDEGFGSPAAGGYRKPELGPDGHEGAVFAVAGSSGKTSGGSFDHPVMVRGLEVLGSMVLDISGNRLDAHFLDDAARVRDSFSIVKSPALLPEPDFEATPLAGPPPLHVRFRDLTVNGPTAWSWDVDADGDVDATVQDPEVTYTTPGWFDVSLRATNVAGTATRTRTGFVCVAGTEKPGPVVGLRFGAGKDRLAWGRHVEGRRYDVVRGDLNTLRASRGNFTSATSACAGNDVGGLEWEDPTRPGPGAALFYLVRAVSCTDVPGTYDTGSARQKGLRDAEIAASGDGCP